MTGEVEHWMSFPPPPGGEEPVMVREDRPCLQCGYNLCGLPVAGNCPECGTPVVNSLRGNLLRYTAPEHLEALHKGVVLVMSGVIAGLLGTVGIIVLQIVSGFVARGPGLPNPTLKVISDSIDLVASGIGLLGWWLLSAPDPSLIGEDRSISSRKLVRAMVIVRVGSALLAFTLQILVLSPAVGPPTVANSALGLNVAAAVIAGVAWIVLFFAAMKYIQWLAYRVPDRSLRDGARRFVWLGPLIYVAGAVCFGLGPLVAMILYLNILNQLRAALKRTGEDAALERVIAAARAATPA